MRFIKEMFQKFHRTQRLDNRGLTLVELLCSMAILGVVSMTVSAVLVVSADSYDRSNSEIKVQQEAQLVANQIDDLLIDATADVSFDATNKILTIKQGAVTHTVEQRGDELYYAKDGVEQLMASGVTKFEVNDTEFAERGYLKLDMDLVRKSQTYPAVFTITARNKDSKEATKVVAAIHLPNQIVLEPNQSYNLAATISGLADANLIWEVVGTSVSSVSGSGLNATVTVGKDEMLESFRVKVTSPEKDANGVDPKAQKMVTVCVRRVNILNVDGSIISGSACMNGAKYNLNANIQGTNLQQVVGAAYDTDYVNPWQVSWSVIEGASYASVAANADTKSATLTLTADIPMGEQVTVQATALHPTGVKNAAGEWTNKASAKAGTATPYGTVVGTFTIKKTQSPFGPSGGGWRRHGDDQQAEVKVDSVIKPLMNAVGATDFKIWFRYREWPSGVMPNKYTENIWGDGHGSSALNMRPLLTGVWDYDKDYEVEIMLSLVDENGNQVWPVGHVLDSNGTLIQHEPGGTPAEDYSFTQKIGRVAVDFYSAPNMLDMGAAPSASNGWKAVGESKKDEASAPTISLWKGNPCTLMEFAEARNIKQDVVENNIRYILEKKQGNEWVNAVGLAGVNAYVQQPSKNCIVKFDGDNFSGSYRIKIYSPNMPNKKLSADGKSVVDGNPAQIDYIFYDEATGHNIYYFNVVQLK